jgi:hypothetical protein
MQHSYTKDQISLEEAYRRVHLEKLDDHHDCGCETDECTCNEKCERCGKPLEGEGEDVCKCEKLDESVVQMAHDYLMSLSDSSLDRLLFWVFNLSGLFGVTAVAGIQHFVKSIGDRKKLNKFLSTHPKIKQDWEDLAKLEKKLEHPDIKKAEIGDEHQDLQKQIKAKLHLIEIRLTHILSEVAHGSEIADFIEKLLELIENKNKKITP